MGNPEKLATYGTQDEKKTKTKTLSTAETIGAIADKRQRKPKGQARYTGSIGYTEYKTQDENRPNKIQTKYMLGTTIRKQTQIM